MRILPKDNMLDIETMFIQFGIAGRILALCAPSSDKSVYNQPERAERCISTNALCLILVLSLHERR